MRMQEAGTEASLSRQVGDLLATMRSTPITTVLGLGLLGMPGVLYLGWPTAIYDQQRIVQVFALLAGVMLFLARGRGQAGTWPSHPWARFGLVLTLVGGGLSVVLAVESAVAVRHASLAILLAMAAWAVAGETRTHGPTPLQAGLVAFAGLAGITTVVLALVDPLEHFHPATIAWSNPRFLGQAVSWTLPVLLGLAVARRGPARYAMLAMTTVWVALAVFSGSRGTWVALPLALVAGSLLLDRARRSSWVQLGAVAVAVGIPSGVLLNRPSGSGRSLERLVGDSGRLELLERTFGLWLERPWFGIGPGGLSLFGAPPAHPHNAPLQVLTEWGLVTTVGLVVLLGLGARVTWRHRAQWRLHLDDTFTVALAASMVAGASHSLVSGVIVTPVSQLLLVMVAGGLLASVRGPSRALHRSPLAAAAVLAVVGLGVTTATTHPAEFERRVPRFWLVNPESFRDLP